ncbi:MucR family transcriptional regulator [Mesorhizobium sp. M0058]|uniref:MucR family transcriptional regulator n=1 Tax=Mesorhizobium sp. M0058 TaxID=2956865 RepID=UPI0033372534
MEARNMRFIELTANIVAAYVGHNSVPAGQLPDLIASVNASVQKLDMPAPVAPAELIPAVNPKKSVFPDYIICLDDGKKFRSLKRHLAALGMTPEQYREKWSLPGDYPMVPPNYSEKRSALAKASGLGLSAHKRLPVNASRRHAVQ